MATLTPQVINRAGITEALVAASGGGDAAPCSSDSYLKVVNGGGGSINVTLAIPTAISPFANVTYTNIVVAVANGSHKVIGPLTPAVFQDPVTSLCTITYSGVTSVTVGVFDFQLP